MAPRIWAVSEDGSIRYQSLTKEYLDQCVTLMRECFFPHENVSKAMGVDTEPGAIDELLPLCIDAAKDGLTIIALDIATDQVASAAFNKIHLRNPVGETFFEQLLKSCKCKSSRGILEYLMKADEECDFFKVLEVDAVVEVLFGVTHPNYRKRGLSLKLHEITVDVARKLNEGENVKQSIDDNELSIEPVPKAVTAHLTTFVTQKICKTLGFSIAGEQVYDKVMVNDKSLGDRIDKKTSTMVFAYKMVV